MQPQQPGYGSSRTYLELLAELPWQVASEEQEIDLVAAKERLDSEHYGLSKVKRRIIEYLAVRKVCSDINPQLKLCLRCSTKREAPSSGCNQVLVYSFLEFFWFFTCTQIMLIIFLYLAVCLMQVHAFLTLWEDWVLRVFQFICHLCRWISLLKWIWKPCNSKYLNLYQFLIKFLSQNTSGPT